MLKMSFRHQKNNAALYQTRCNVSSVSSSLSLRTAQLGVGVTARSGVNKDASHAMVAAVECTDHVLDGGGGEVRGGGRGRRGRGRRGRAGRGAAAHAQRHQQPLRRAVVHARAQPAVAREPTQQQIQSHQPKDIDSWTRVSLRICVCVKCLTFASSFHRVVYEKYPTITVNRD